MTYGSSRGAPRGASLARRRATPAHPRAATPTTPERIVSAVPYGCSLVHCAPMTVELDGRSRLRLQGLDVALHAGLTPPERGTRGTGKPQVGELAGVVLLSPVHTSALLSGGTTWPGAYTLHAHRMVGFRMEAGDGLDVHSSVGGTLTVWACHNGVTLARKLAAEGR
jgi:hypothetical protein